jgi:hypothetical protein
LNAPGWEEAVTVIECLVSKLEMCEASLRPVVQSHIQVQYVRYGQSVLCGSDLRMFNTLYK